MKRIALFLFLVSCAPLAPTYPTYSVYIESRFTAQQRTIIQESMNDWTTKSNSLVTFNSTIVQTCGTKVTPHTIKIIVSTQAAVDEACYPGVAGCTVMDSDEKLLDSSRIYLAMDRDYALYFPSVVRHEIGHSLGLGHESDSPLMMTKIRDPRSRVTCKDVNRLYALHHAPYSCSE